VLKWDVGNRAAFASILLALQRCPRLLLEIPYSLGQKEEERRKNALSLRLLEKEFCVTIQYRAGT
jgi:hypothetical protein